MRALERRLRLFFCLSAPEMLLLFGLLCCALRLFGMLEFFRSGVLLHNGPAVWIWVWLVFDSYFAVVLAELMADFFRDPRTALVPFRVTLAGAAAFWAAVLLGRAQPPAVWAWWLGRLVPTGGVFLALLVVIFLAVIHLTHQTPLERELDQAVRWPRRVNHGPHAAAAAKEGLTYIGFEAGAKRPVTMTGEERSQHVHVLGSTGTGKTKRVLLPMVAQDLAAGRGVLFVDAKGSRESFGTFKRLVRQAGREKDFLYFSLTDVARSVRYNPLQNGNASQLKDKIVATIDWSEPYYQRVCEEALQAIFMGLDEQGQRVCLRELSQLLRASLAGPRGWINKKTIGTLFSEINLLIQTPFAALLDTTKPDIDLLDVYRNKKVAYFSLDMQSYGQTAARLGKMITQDVNTLSGVVTSQFRPGERAVLAVYIDEFQSFGTRGFLNALARGRESGLWITLAHQSMGDLLAVDKAYSQQVTDLTNTKIFTRVNDPGTAREFSEIAGMEQRIKNVQQAPISERDRGDLIVNQRGDEVYRINPDELKRLETGQAVFKSGGRSGRLVLPEPVLPREEDFLAGEKINLPVRSPVNSEGKIERRILL